MSRKMVKKVKKIINILMQFLMQCQRKIGKIKYVLSVMNLQNAYY